MCLSRAAWQARWLGSWELPAAGLLTRELIRHIPRSPAAAEVQSACHCPGSRRACSSISRWQASCAALTQSSYSLHPCLSSLKWILLESLWGSNEMMHMNVFANRNERCLHIISQLWPQPLPNPPPATPLHLSTWKALLPSLPEHASTFPPLLVYSSVFSLPLLLLPLVLAPSPFLFPRSFSSSLQSWRQPDSFLSNLIMQCIAPLNWSPRLAQVDWEKALTPSSKR